MLLFFLFVFTAKRKNEILRSYESERRIIEEREYKACQLEYEKQLTCARLAESEYQNNMQASANRFSEHENYGIQTRLEQLKETYISEKRKAQEIFNKMQALQKR